MALFFYVFIALLKRIFFKIILMSHTSDGAIAKYKKNKSIGVF